MAIHEAGHSVPDDVAFAWQVLRHFGFIRAIGILARGARLATELPPPARGQKLIAHCATRADYRGRGALTALMTNTLQAVQPPFVLDVRLDNSRARALYSRLGFDAMKRNRCSHPRVPSELRSERRRFDKRRHNPL
ncbi:GNAT family N-acetyltransferase [Caballeronia sp. RCC_10]|uniref:GNAT family N-acetyltransferase n=1 Tax=Caballeronia sp. RCC_10 TaxID=3239227 RepID=UPI003523765D